MKRRTDRLRDLDPSESKRADVKGRPDAKEAPPATIDRARARRAGRAMDRFRNSLPAGEYDSAKEIRKWRDRNFQS